MPFEHALWKLGGTLTRLAPTAHDDEKALEDYISSDIGILSDRFGGLNLRRLKQARRPTRRSRTS
jgi:hypothetical protein